MSVSVSEQKRVLVVRAGALGDTLMTTPLLRALRESSPERPIDVLCAASAAPLLERNTRVAEVLPLRYRNLPYALSPEKQRLTRTLRARGYTQAILLERRHHYRRLLERAGIESIRSFRETPFDPKTHAIVNNLRAAGLEADGADLDMEAHWSGDDERRAKTLILELPRPLVGIHMGYGPRGKKRRQSERLKGWPLAHFVELCQTLSHRGSSLVFTGSSEDRRDVGRVTSRLSGASFANLAGRTSVCELAALISRLDLFVSVDSGPAHLAAAVATPLVVLWGPAILEQVRPISSRSPVVVLRHPVPCAPCYETPLMKTCRQNVCMESITPDEVASSAASLLSV
ncbi:MAG TPA: glycosyltransferase family 9 protein [Vicinamibacteria bacterium]|nr:glycosyltransferase family 9 protein [Vicinamibacteria bacterium]